MLGAGRPISRKGSSGTLRADSIEVRQVHAATAAERRPDTDYDLGEECRLAGLFDNGGFLQTGGIQDAAHAGYEGFTEADFCRLGFVARHFGVDELTAEELIGS